MNESLRRVDAHQHFWRYVLGEFDWMGANMAELRRDFLPPELRLLLDREKIGGTVAVQSRASEADTDFLLEHPHQMALRHAELLRDVDRADVTVFLLHHQHRFKIVFRCAQNFHRGYQLSIEITIG